MVWKPTIVYVIDMARPWVAWERRRWCFAMVEVEGRQVGEIIVGESHGALLSKARALWHQHGNPEATPTVVLTESTVASEDGPGDRLPMRCPNCGRLSGELLASARGHDSIKPCPKCHEMGHYCVEGVTSLVRYRIVTPGRRDH